ncbi:hypothetical protein B0A52_10376 [Exophiala mesophila]|uniref:peptidylprolyl isomerase n=1 Tax=Exophiala mesophila TaxID=212818 RepID=A0A438MQ94_EXOME|nr:hypothetical protein B0A52_10376 [Exophiala mesophila]
MAVSLQKRILRPGNGKDYPRKLDEVIIEYTGWLHDANLADQGYKGEEFDSSAGRGEFKIQIGVGKVIPGWDQLVPQMSLGEKATLTIPGHLAYGTRGFPGLIPKNATLIFDVYLKGINKRMS